MACLRNDARNLRAQCAPRIHRAPLFLSVITSLRGKDTSLSNVQFRLARDTTRTSLANYHETLSPARITFSVRVSPFGTILPVFFEIIFPPVREPFAKQRPNEIIHLYEKQHRHPVSNEPVTNNRYLWIVIERRTAINFSPYFWTVVKRWYTSLRARNRPVRAFFLIIHFRGSVGMILRRLPRSVCNDTRTVTRNERLYIYPDVTFNLADCISGRFDTIFKSKEISRGRLLLEILRDYVHFYTR